MVRIDPSRALGAYAAVMTAVAGWLALSGIAPDPVTRFDTIDVARINVREPDGTLRMAIASHARMPGIVMGKADYPHPNRPEAGMIFYNDEGMENGGLVFDGGSSNGRPSNSGSFTFDRRQQDQTIQVRSSEDGDRREAGLAIYDRPDGPIDYPNALAAMKLLDGPGKDAALKAANVGGRVRAYLGRGTDGTSQLVLRDGLGKPRLQLTVAADGTSGIDFLDGAGRVSRHFP